MVDCCLLEGNCVVVKIITICDELRNEPLSGWLLFVVFICHIPQYRHIWYTCNYIGRRSGLIIVCKSTQILSDYILACKCSIGIGQDASLMICDHNDCHSVVDCYFHLSICYWCWLFVVSIVHALVDNKIPFESVMKWCSVQAIVFLLPSVVDCCLFIVACCCCLVLILIVVDDYGHCRRWMLIWYRIISILIATQWLIVVCCFHLSIHLYSPNHIITLSSW